MKNSSRPCCFRLRNVQSFTWACCYAGSIRNNSTDVMCNTDFTLTSVIYFNVRFGLMHIGEDVCINSLM